MKSGVYKITNKVNGNFYIGSASDLDRRIKRHRYDLRLNQHHSQYLQRAWNKYGEENFKFEILEYCAVDNILVREQKYLDELKPKYNVSKNATAFMLGIKRPKSFGENISRLKKGNKYFEGKTHTDKAKRKIAISKLGNNWNVGKSHCQETKDKIREKTLKQFKDGMPIETRRKLGKPVVQLSMDFEFIAKYYTAKEAAEATGISKSHMCSVCKGYRTSTGGYRWMYYEDYLNSDISALKEKAKLPRPKAIVESSNHWKQVVNLDTSLEFKTIKAAADYYGIDPSAITKCCKGKYKSAGGYKWAYKED